MELFRSPPEDFLVSSAAGSMWTWVAVLTAAVGLWRIRAVGSKSNAPPSPISSPSPPPCKALMARPAEEIRTTKEVFTMVYPFDSAVEGFECGGIECDEITREEEEELAGGGELVVPLERSDWMSLWVRKRSDLGWYRYQDRTAINGSVVRLWCGGGIKRRV